MAGMDQHGVEATVLEAIEVLRILEQMVGTS
jgi:hypothetical protein